VLRHVNLLSDGSHVGNLDGVQALAAFLTFDESSSFFDSLHPVTLNLFILPSLPHPHTGARYPPQIGANAFFASGATSSHAVQLDSEANDVAIPSPHAGWNSTMCTLEETMTTILIIVVLLMLFGGGGNKAIVSALAARPRSIERNAR
jgi:hypothetical protein